METIGRLAAMLALDAGENLESLIERGRRAGFVGAQGRVGTMDLEKVVAAVETAAKRNGLMSTGYRDEHALFHAAIEALEGVCRGQMALGEILRTVGLRFALVRGPKIEGEKEEGEWIAVCMYGTIGAPIKGYEHEVIGLGIMHI